MESNNSNENTKSNNLRQKASRDPLVTITNGNGNNARRPGRPPGPSVKNKNTNYTPSKSTLKRKREANFNELTLNDGVLCAKKKFVESHNPYAARILDIIKDPAKAQMLYQLFEKQKRKETYFTPEEALAVFSHVHLTKNSYIVLRSIFQNQELNALPSYYQVNNYNCIYK